MKTQKLSLRKIVSYLNNSDEDGGFWLPNIQRPFVWSEEQICRLFDSILRQYPISTLLVWKTKAGVRRRKFIDNFREEHRTHLGAFAVPDDELKKCLVLDGQQRLQSLFIGLRGSYDGEELFIDILSGEVSAPDDIKYRFKFLDPKTAAFPHIRFKDIVFSEARPRVISEGIVATAGRDLSQVETDKVADHVNLIREIFLNESGIAYQELDSIEQATLYSEDDVVEIFIRANSGGTKLGKSDLLFSLLAATWDEANDQMEALLDTMNRTGFLFTRDFILKTFLTLLDEGARYEVGKFRKPGIRERIEKEWKGLTNAVMDVADFVATRTFIRCDKALPSYLALIPLVYTRHHLPAAWKAAEKDVEVFLLRSLLTGAFGLRPDQLIDDLVTKISQTKAFNITELFEVIRSGGRSLELTDDRFWAMGYGSDQIHLLFNLWYREFNYVPSYPNNRPQVDHIFPQSLLKKVPALDPATGRRVGMKYHAEDRNQLANCMLLTAVENGGGGKSDTPPDEWFAQCLAKDPDYLAKHLIPTDAELWQPDRFEEFLAERKKLIRARFADLFATNSVATA